MQLPVGNVDYMNVDSVWYYPFLGKREDPYAESVMR